MSEISNWDDDCGLVSFLYRGELCSVMDHPGEFMEVRYRRFVLKVWLGTYPTPDLVQRIIEDFVRCNPEEVKGVWEWKNGSWKQKNS